MEAVDFSPISVLVDHANLQHAGIQGFGAYCIGYHSHLLSENHDLLNAIALA